MKNRHYLLLAVITLLLFSCSIEKRLYRPGFYVSNRIETSKKLNQSSLVEENKSTGSTTLRTESITGITEDLLNETVSDNKTIPHKTEVKKKKNSEHRSEKLKADQPLLSISNGAITLQTQKNKPQYRDYEDTLILLGLIIGFSGVVLLIIGAALMSSNPPLSTMFFTIGLILLVAGIITAGIGDPSIFLDVILAILEAL